MWACWYLTTNVYNKLLPLILICQFKQLVLTQSGKKKKLSLYAIYFLENAKFHEFECTITFEKLVLVIANPNNHANPKHYRTLLIVSLTFILLIAQISHISWDLLVILFTALPPHISIDNQIWWFLPHLLLVIFVMILC